MVSQVPPPPGEEPPPEPRHDDEGAAASHAILWLVPPCVLVSVLLVQALKAGRRDREQGVTEVTPRGNELPPLRKEKKPPPVGQRFPEAVGTTSRN